MEALRMPSQEGESGYQQRESGLLIPEREDIAALHDNHAADFRVPEGGAIALPDHLVDQRTKELIDQIYKGKPEEQKEIITSLDDAPADLREQEKKDDPFPKMFEMTGLGIHHNLQENSLQIYDKLSQKMDVFDYKKLVTESARELDFSKDTFEYESIKDVDTKFSTLAAFYQYGDVNPQEFWSYAFMMAKLGRFKEGNVISDEFKRFTIDTLTSLDHKDIAYTKAETILFMFADTFTAEQAVGAMSVLKQKDRIAGSLGQKLLQKFPEELASYNTTVEISEDADEIIANIDEYTHQAMNEGNIVRDLPTKIGIEIEMKLSGEQGRESDERFYKENVEPFKKFLKGDCHDDLDSTEIKTKNEGVKWDVDSLNSFTSVVQSISRDHELSSFGTVHINLDRRDLKENDSPFMIRRYEGNRAEVTEIPVLSTRNFTCLSLDAVRTYDQATMLGLLSDLSLENVRKYIDPEKDKEVILMRDQAYMRDFYLRIASEAGRTEAIPAILRCAQDQALPAINFNFLKNTLSVEDLERIFTKSNVYRAEGITQIFNLLNAEMMTGEELLSFLTSDEIGESYKDIFIGQAFPEISFDQAKLVLYSEDDLHGAKYCISKKIKNISPDELLEVLSRDTLDDEDKGNLIHGAKGLTIESISEIMKSDSIDNIHKLSIFGKIDECSFEEGLPMLEDEKFSVSVKVRIAHAITEISLEQAMPFFEDDSLDESVQSSLASKVSVGNIAEIKSLLINPDFSSGFKYLLLDDLSDVPLSDVEPLLKRDAIDDSTKAQMIRSCSTLSLEDVSSYLFDSACGDGLRIAFAQRVEGIAYEDVRSIFEDEKADRYLLIALAESISEVSFEDALPFFKDYSEESFASSGARLSETLAEKLSDVKSFKQVQEFLEKSDVSSDLKKIVLKKATEESFEEFSNFLRDQSVSDLKRGKFVDMISEQPLEDLIPILQDEEFNKILKGLLVSEATDITPKGFYTLFQDENFSKELAIRLLDKVESFDAEEVVNFMETLPQEFARLDFFLEKVAEFSYEQVRDVLLESKYSNLTKYRIVDKIDSLSFDEFTSFAQTEPHGINIIRLLRKVDDYAYEQVRALVESDIHGEYKRDLQKYLEDHA